jgi:ribulose-5-phosphate 4-epimerase/fuculose-1-phosphate aldolase
MRPTRDRLMPELDTRQEIAVLARALWREGYDDHLAGHITVNMGDGTLLCSPWLLTWAEVRPEDVIRIDLDGNLLEGDWPVPLGIPLHLALHQYRHDVKVAMHNHSRYATVWADMGKLPPVHDQSSALGGGGELVLVDEYDGPVSDANRARGAVEAMGDAELALLANHGVFVLGSSIRAVHQRAVALEWRCRVAWQVLAGGGGTELAAPVRERFAQGDGNGFVGFWEAGVRQELAADPTLLDG